MVLLDIDSFCHKNQETCDKKSFNCSPTLEQCKKQETHFSKNCPESCNACRFYGMYY